MSRRDRNTSGRPVARAAAKYTVYNVTEPCRTDGVSDEEDGGDKSHSCEGFAYQSCRTGR